MSSTIGTNTNGGPPPMVPPRRKRAPTVPVQVVNHTNSYDDGDIEGATTNQLVSNPPRAKYSNDYDDDNNISNNNNFPTSSTSSLPSRSAADIISRDVLEEQPETTVGKQVKMKGELSFDRLLRVDGSFEGRLVSKGDLIIGKTGMLVGDIKDMGVLICEGKIVGDISVQRLELRGKACVHGNISCKSIKVDPGVVLVGQVNVNPFAPSKIDYQGNIVGDDEILSFPEDGKDKRKVPAPR